MDGIPFVDAHVHFWSLDHLRYPWLSPPFSPDGPNGSVEAIARDYGPEDYRADLRDWNVVGAVHVDAGADPDDALEETRWLDALADTSGLPSGIVAYAALERWDVETQLRAQAAHTRVRGIRQILNWHPDPGRSYTPRDLTGEPQWQAGFAVLASFGLSFDLQCYPGQMAGMATLIARHPTVSVIVNHMGMPVLDDPGGLDDWRRGLKALAALPQVSIKLSGLGFIRRDWSSDLVQPLLREVVDLFGTDRSMLASDVPTDTLFAPVTKYRDTYAAFLGGYSEAERRDLAGRNANRIYRLDLDI